MIEGRQAILRYKFPNDVHENAKADLEFERGEDHLTGEVNAIVSSSDGPVADDLIVRLEALL